MLRCSVAALTVVTGMLASTAVPAGVASGAPNTFADQRVSKLTADGWRVSAVKSQEKVHSVAPLNQSPWTREGFLSLRGAGHIAGSGREPVTAGTVTAGFQVGCNTDVTSGLALGVTAGPTAQMSISWPPALIVGAQAMPNVATTLKPGTIADVPFGTRPSPARAVDSLSMGCMSRSMGVSVRSPCGRT